MCRHPCRRQTEWNLVPQIISLAYLQLPRHCVRAVEKLPCRNVHLSTVSVYSRNLLVTLLGADDRTTISLSDLK